MLVKLLIMAIIVILTTINSPVLLLQSIFNYLFLPELNAASQISSDKALENKGLNKQKLFIIDKE